MLYIGTFQHGQSHKLIVDYQNGINFVHMIWVLSKLRHMQTILIPCSNSYLDPSIWDMLRLFE